MAINKLKVLLSFMREINDGNIPTHSDYGLEKSEFYDIIEACQDEGLIKGAKFSRGKGNEIVIAFLEHIKLTVKGMEYLDEHSATMNDSKN